MLDKSQRDCIASYVSTPPCFKYGNFHDIHFLFQGKGVAVLQMLRGRETNTFFFFIDLGIYYIYIYSDHHFQLGFYTHNISAVVACSLLHVFGSLINIRKWIKALVETVSPIGFLGSCSGAKSYTLVQSMKRTSST